MKKNITKIIFSIFMCTAIFIFLNGCAVVYNNLADTTWAYTVDTCVDGSGIVGSTVWSFSSEKCSYKSGYVLTISETSTTYIAGNIYGTPESKADTGTWNATSATEILVNCPGVGYVNQTVAIDFSDDGSTITITNDDGEFVLTKASE